jgi:NAD(P)-dependent dehydrogenase (short-subunit alcohol dehydrogenase family)
MSVSMAVLCVVVAALLWWLLQTPYRGVGHSHYATSRRFLLTGCASGMGRHLTGVLLRAGHRVLATDVDAAVLAQVAAEDGWEGLAKEAAGAAVHACALDVTARPAWEAALATVDQLWGGLDVCMNIAGLLVPKKIQDAHARDIDLHVDVMVKVRRAAVTAGSTAAPSHSLTIQSLPRVGRRALCTGRSSLPP